MATHLNPAPAIMFTEDVDMGRRRLQKNGELYQQGGWWKLRWREDVIGEDGDPKRGKSKPAWIGPSEGRGAMTKKEAQRIAWDNFLSRLDQNTVIPQSVMTVGHFVEKAFVPEHVQMLKDSGAVFYRTQLKHVLNPDLVNRIFGMDAEKYAKYKNALKPVAGWPYLDDVKLRDVRQDHLQKIISAALKKKYSPATLTAIKNTCSAIFTCAKGKGWFAGDNPAELVKLPELEPVKELHALNLQQSKAVLAKMRYPEYHMALIAILSSMNIAEICGLQWKRVNLTDQYVTVDGESIPPFALLVRKQWILYKLTTTKKKSRRRALPIPPALLPVFQDLKRRAAWVGPDDYVLVSGKGTPVDAHNILTRRLKAIGKGLGMPWLSWHSFRRTHTTLADELGMSFQDRQAMMGHSGKDTAMTLRYTKVDMERRSGIMEGLATRLIDVPEGPVQ